jgi:hypothetical protein
MNAAWRQRMECARLWLERCQQHPEELIEQSARLMHAFVVWVLRWLTGRDLRNRDDTRPSGIPALATLLALAIAQGLVLLVVHYEGARRLYSLSVFGLVAIIVIGGMIGIMRAASLQQPHSAAFDSATVRWGSWALFWTGLGLTLTLGTVAFDLAPRKPTATMVQEIDYDWKFDKSAGKKLVYLIAPPTNGSFWNPMRMDVKVGEAIAADWDIEHVVGYADKDLEQELEREGPAEVEESTAKHYIGKWYNLGKGPYFVLVALHSPTNATRDDLNRKLKEGKGAVEITFGPQ